SERNEAMDALKKEMIVAFAGAYEPNDVAEAFEYQVKSELRAMVLNEGRRADGRDYTTIRPIACETGLLPRAHGSGLFTRGETQVLTIATLGMPNESQTIDSLSTEDEKRFMHHYNFPPYSVGEARSSRGPGRREIGHGALAERALAEVIPDSSEFPYTIRLVSEVMSSNGSTSMASVCGSTLALMDAGVPIKAPVAGVAMGLITEGAKSAILTDIIGMEDFLGDMDFKVAGSAAGITALQLDLKLQGVAPDLLHKAMMQAKQARLFILDKMLQVMPEPRADISSFAPRITVIKIDPEKIGALIGPGGKNVRKLQEEFSVKVDIEEDGTVFIASTNREGTMMAVERIRGMTESPKLGAIYTGKVVRIEDFGAFVELAPGEDGMVHKSQLADFPVNNVRDVVKLGDEVMVMVTGIDDGGKIRLSRQAVIEGWTVEEAQARDRGPRGGGERGGERGRGRDDRGGRGRDGDRGGRGGGGYRPKLVKGDLVLREGDEVGFLPPVSGGAKSLDRENARKARKPRKVLASRKKIIRGDSRDSRMNKDALITRKPLDLAALIKRVAFPGAGAIITFSGVVRDNAHGKAVKHLEYEAYPEMAEATMRE
ncbi:MAG: polyribonucleotide nucleotidyltransferase, partial [Chloroflexi bacterium]|nr:polyribonucleotide nucleotidyltransferase [Chloroflexota bacterium]